MARIGIGILLTKSEWSELVLVFYWCPKVDNAQPCSLGSRYKINNSVFHTTMHVYYVSYVTFLPGISFYEIPEHV